MIAPALVTALLLAAPVPLPEAPAPEVYCAIDDDRLAELSGLAVDADGLWGISDDGPRIEIHRIEIHRIDPDIGTDGCGVLDTRTARIDPRDAEDLAVGPDGTLWVGDIGDNDRQRDTVAVIVVPARGPARLHRLRYPDGPHDAEALLVDATGAPVIVTKDPVGRAGIYRTDGPPVGEGPTPLLRVGELALPASDTDGGPLGGLGARLVTGAAVSTDRRVVAVRTYTDAWLYPAPDGDVVAALARAPVRVPLPDEPQGEAIAFLPDGTLLSGSETRGADVGLLRAVPGAVRLAGGALTPPATEPVRPADAEPPDWLPATIGGAASIGLLLLAALALARRR